jgi:hypothetical protein
MHEGTHLHYLKGQVQIYSTGPYMEWKTEVDVN